MQSTLLTKAMLLVSQNCLPFSLFDSPLFQEYVNVAIDLGRAHKYQPVRSHHLKKHIFQVYDEVKLELRKRLSSTDELHISIDSCTFNSTKNIFNIIVSYGETEWHIGHAYSQSCNLKMPKPS